MGVYVAEAALIEPYDIEDVFVHGVGRIEMTSAGEARIIFYSERNGERVAKFALVISAPAAIAGMAQLNQALGGLRMLRLVN